MTKSKKNDQKVETSKNSCGKSLRREHNEFYNCFTIETVTHDITFLNYLYDNKTGLNESSVDQDFIFELKSIAKESGFSVRNALMASFLIFLVTIDTIKTHKQIGLRL